MNLKLVGALALIVVASGCVSSNSQPATPDAENPEESRAQPEPADGNGELQESATVYFTDSGFTPQTVRIRQGGTVTFRNNASGQMWVGSDNHPTHTEYAGSSVREHCQNGEPTGDVFDQCSTGETYSFTFEKTGTWGYHNHVAPQYSGEVIVG